MRKLKNNKIDLVRLFNIIMIIINVVNVVLSFINIWINTNTIRVINYTVVLISIILASAEFITLRHNEKVIMNLLYGRIKKWRKLHYM